MGGKREQVTDAGGGGGGGGASADLQIGVNFLKIDIDVFQTLILAWIQLLV